MNLENPMEIPSSPPNDLVWIISEGNLSEIDLNEIECPPPQNPVKAYYISDFANYLLNPNPVQVKKKLIGCEVRRPLPFSARLKEKFRNFLSTSGKANAPEKNSGEKTEFLISQCRAKPPALKDRNLEAHFEKIDEHLLPYDTTIKQLLDIEEDNVSSLMGICEDKDKNRSLLNLQGNFSEQINFMINNINKDVGVLLNMSQIADGLFDMGGFDFTSYRPERRHKLIRFYEDGKPKYCVLRADNNVSYWIKNNKTMQFLHLLDQSIRTNSKLKESIQQCIEGDAKPLKLFFNQELEIDYACTRPPEVYRQVFESRRMEITEMNVVIDSLKHLQLGISLNYILKSESGKEKLCTSMSVMHDIRALDPIKDIVPEVYTEINKRTHASEAGRFYLLDAIRGYRNEL